MPEVNRRGSKRWTAKFRRTNEREQLMQLRIARELRRVGFNVEILTTFDRYGIRNNGVNLSAALGGYMVHLVIVLPGHKPDELQRACIASDPYAVYVCSVAEALRAVSVGILA